MTKEFNPKNAAIDVLNQPCVFKAPPNPVEEDTPEGVGQMEIFVPAVSEHGNSTLAIFTAINDLLPEKLHLTDNDFVAAYTQIGTFVLNAEQSQTLASEGVNLPGYPAPNRAQGWANSV